MGVVAYFNVFITAIFGVIWLGSVMFLRFKRHRHFVCLALFTVFYVYIFKVLDYTLFQYQSLLIMKYVVPGLILRGQEEGNTLNLVPLVTLTRADLKTSLLNVLLLMPFGFGLPFIARLTLKQIVLSGALFSVAIELVQLITGYIAKVTFRIADINDVIFNTAGVVIGYWAFAAFAKWVRSIGSKWLFLPAE
jgi:glycopeptide antibiotics resistance protein